jgi:anti-sigma regulatory factor (Ser/Thr protein kinase)
MAVLNELTFRLSRRRSSVPRARAVLLAALAGWGAGRDLVESAELVLSELVTNALRVRVPRDRLVGVRIVHSEMNGVLRLEVSDAGGGRPEVRLPTEEQTSGRGLLLVDALAYRWGVQPRAADIGKTVWAELKAPDLPPPPLGREVAAVTVRPGQHVRAWGSWHPVRSVRTEPFPSGDLAIVIGLDEGPALRLPACEPLTVRDA